MTETTDRREDWQPDSDRWRHLTDQLAALPQPVNPPDESLLPKAGDFQP